MTGCGPCGECFVTVDAFDEHRVGFHAFTFSEGVQQSPPRYDGRRCLAPSEMLEQGWIKSERGWMYPHDWERQGWRWDLDHEQVEITA